MIPSRILEEEGKKARKIGFRQVAAQSQEKLMYYSENNDSLVVRNSEKERVSPDIFFPFGGSEIPFERLGC